MPCLNLRNGSRDSYTRLFANVDIFESLSYSFTQDSQLSFLPNRIKDKPQARFANMFMSDFCNLIRRLELVEFFHEVALHWKVQECNEKDSFVCKSQVYQYYCSIKLSCVSFIATFKWIMPETRFHRCFFYEKTFRELRLFLDWPLFSCLKLFQTFHNLYCSKSAYMLHWRQLKGNILNIKCPVKNKHDLTRAIYFIKLYMFWKQIVCICFKHLKVWKVSYYRLLIDLHWRDFLSIKTRRL